MGPSNDAIRAAWEAYEKQVWAVAGSDVMGEPHKNNCMKIAIEAAAKHDKVRWTYGDSSNSPIYSPKYPYR